MQLLVGEIDKENMKYFLMFELVLNLQNNYPKTLKPLTASKLSEFQL